MQRTISVFFLLLLFPLSASAAPPTSPYAPGETLAPDCDPGDTNCTVLAPLTAEGSPTSGYLSVWNTVASLEQSTALFWDETNDRLGIGTAVPAVTLDVAGTTRLSGGSALRFSDDDDLGYVGFKAPSTVATTTTWTLPDADGLSGQLLSTDGAGALSWSTGSGISSLNGLNGATQTFAVGTSGTDFGISSSGSAHTFNLPSASAASRGLLTAADWTAFDEKLGTGLEDGRIWIGSGSDLAAAVALSGDASLANTGALTIAPNAVALGADTTGDYVASLDTSVLTGLTGGAAGSESTVLSLAFDYSQALSGDVGLASNAAVFGQSGLIFEGGVADGIETFLVISNPTTSDKTITFPDVSLTVNAAADISGATLASNVIASSLTSVGTLSSLALSGAITGATGFNGLVVTPNTGVVTSGTWNGTTIALANGGTGTTDGSITGSGALTFASNTVNALSLDSGTTGNVNIGTGASAKTVTIGNTTGATSLALQSGSGRITMQVAGTGTTGNVQMGAGGGGSTTPDLLVLDAKSTSDDPTGTEGALYYNASTDRFRCFQSSAWMNCAGPDGNTFFEGKLNDQAVTSSTTLTSESELAFPVGSGETWAFSYELFITNASSAQPDLKMAILGASGWTCSAQMSGNEANGAVFPQTVTTDCDNAPTAMVNGTIGSDGGEGITVRVMGTVTTTSAGTVTLQFAQNVLSASALTIKAGSNVSAFRTAGSDVAETYYSDEPLAPGTVVSIDTSDGAPFAGVRKSSGTGDRALLGVVSTRPGLIIGDHDGSSNGIPTFIALTGRVPVTVSAENGPIRAGNYLTSAAISGVAMRAESDASIIGQALTAFDGDGVGQVLMLVKNFEIAGEDLHMDELTTGDGLSSLMATIRSEAPRDAVAALENRISRGAQLFTDLFAARVTAVRGYFEETFVTTSHQERICVGTANDEVCLTKPQIESLLSNERIDPPPPAPTPPPAEPVQTEPTEAPEEVPEPSPSDEPLADTPAPEPPSAS